MRFLAWEVSVLRHMKGTILHLVSLRFCTARPCLSSSRIEISVTKNYIISNAVNTYIVPPNASRSSDKRRIHYQPTHHPPGSINRTSPQQRCSKLNIIMIAWSVPFDQSFQLSFIPFNAESTVARTKDRCPILLFSCSHWPPRYHDCEPARYITRHTPGYPYSQDQCLQAPPLILSMRIGA